MCGAVGVSGQLASCFIFSLQSAANSHEHNGVTCLRRGGGGGATYGDTHHLSLKLMHGPVTESQGGDKSLGSNKEMTNEWDLFGLCVGTHTYKVKSTPM